MRQTPVSELCVNIQMVYCETDETVEPQILVSMDSLLICADVALLGRYYKHLYPD